MEVDEKPLTLPLRFDMIDMLGSLCPDFLYAKPLKLDKKPYFAYNISYNIQVLYTIKDDIYNGRKNHCTRKYTT